MIRDNEVFKIGYISKQRGLRGEVEMVFTDDCFDTGSADYLVLDMDGILVPFFWEEYSFKNNETAILKFEEIDSEEQARKLVGHSVYYPKEHTAEADENEGATFVVVQSPDRIRCLQCPRRTGWFDCSCG